MSFDDAYGDIDYDLSVLIHEARNLCGDDWSLPKRRTGKSEGATPEEKAASIAGFKQAIQKQNNRRVMELWSKATTTEQQLKVMRKRVMKVPWEGEWVWSAAKYVGTGEYKGVERPQDHAPNWWKKEKLISMQRYLDCYRVSSYYQEIQKEFWFATEAQIESAHDLVNEWIDRINLLDNDNIKNIRKKPERKVADLDDKYIKKLFDDGVFKRGKKK